MPARQIIVIGHVQGVGFRAYVSCVAAIHDVTGEVWNRRDGGVEMIAEHAQEEMLDRFQAKLKNGPGRVDNVQAYPASPQDYSRFGIGPTR